MCVTHLLVYYSLTEHLRLSCTHLLHTLLNFPLPLDIPVILSYTNTSRVYAFGRLLVSTKNEEKNRFADRLIELANRGFGLSTDAFLKSVKKFLDKKVRTCTSRSRSPPYASHLLCFISRCLVPRSIYIFRIDCQTTL